MITNSGNPTPVPVITITSLKTSTFTLAASPVFTPINVLMGYQLTTPYPGVDFTSYFPNSSAVTVSKISASSDIASIKIQLHVLAACANFSSI